MKKRLSIPLLLSAALLLYTMLAPTPNILPQEPTGVSSGKPIPESYAADVLVRDFDEAGVLVATTEAIALRRFPASETLELDQPKRHSFADTDEWIATANAGELMERQDLLDLNGDVRLRYTQEGVEFQTASMRIKLDDRTARSTAPVRVWQGQNETVADQLFINLDRQYAALSGQVRTRYVPEE